MTRTALALFAALCLSAPAAAQDTPRLSDKPSEMTHAEYLVRSFCEPRGLEYGTDECRDAFLKAWAEASWDEGRELTREGLEQLDGLGQDGARALGRKWEEYRRAFREGREAAKAKD